MSFWNLTLYYLFAFVCRFSFIISPAQGTASLETASSGEGLPFHLGVTAFGDDIGVDFCPTRYYIGRSVLHFTHSLLGRPRRITRLCSCLFDFFGNFGNGTNIGRRASSF